jgi:3D (Asp-Asp-Asp) domain-containing protein
MNYRHLFVFCTCAVGALLSSCSLPISSGLAVSSGLQEGVRYEVRKAVGSNQAFEPWELRSVFFVLKPQAPPVIAGTRAGRRGVLSVRTTAYCHSEADHLPFGRLSASGNTLRYGIVRSAAADWSRFPLGTQFRIKSQPGVLYEVDDYGSALVGSNTIDLYCPTRRTMDNWGVRNCDIEVLHWGSFSASLEMMKTRVNFPHVRTMMREITARLGGSSRYAHADNLSNTTPVTAMAAPSKFFAFGTSPSL